MFEFLCIDIFRVLKKFEYSRQKDNNFRKEKSFLPQCVFQPPKHCNLKLHFAPSDVYLWRDVVSQEIYAKYPKGFGGGTF